MTANTVHTLWEYERRSISLNAVQVEHIGRLGRKVLTYERGLLRAGSWVGVAALPGVQVEVLPKLFRTADAGDGTRDTASRNLLHLLQFAGVLPRQSRRNEASLTARKTYFFDILTYLYASHLLELLRHSRPRSYEQIEDNAPFLRGRWDIAVQMMRAPHLQHRFYTVYDEFTADTALHRVLKLAARLLLGITHDVQNRRLLSDILQQYADVGDTDNAVRDMRAVAFTRLNISYSRVYRTACLVIRQLSAQLLHGTQQMWSILFDMNRIFEQCVASVIRRKHLLSGTPYEHCELLVQKRGRHLVRDTRGKPHFLLHPDIRIADVSGTQCIIDTKYKPLDARTSTGGVTQADMYQMYAYARQFDCPRVVLLYPCTGLFGRHNEQKYKTDDGRVIEIRTVDLRGNLGEKQERMELYNDLKRIIMGA